MTTVKELYDLLGAEVNRNPHAEVRVMVYRSDFKLTGPAGPVAFRRLERVGRVLYVIGEEPRPAEVVRGRLEGGDPR